MRRVHLAIDAVGNRSAGGATVLLDLLEAAVEHPQIEQITCFTSPPSRRTFALPHHRRLAEKPVGLPDLSGATRAIWHARLLSRAVTACGAELLLALNGMGQTSGVPTVQFVQQSLPFCPAAYRAYPPRARVRLHSLRVLTRHYLRRAQAVAVQTPWMAETVRALMGDAAVPVEHFLPCVSLPEGGPQLATVLGGPEPAEGGYLLYVGSDRPHKGLDELLDGFRQLKREGSNVQLVATLPAGHPAGRVPGVHCIGHRRRNELRTLYEHASLLVMTSIVETVGLPLLEAMLAGTSVLAVDRPYARDVCGDAAHFFRPDDAASFASVAGALLSDESARKEMGQAGRRRVQELLASRPYSRLLDYALAAAGA